MIPKSLTAFLLARLDEQDELADSIEGNPEYPRGPHYVSGVGRVAVVGGDYLFADSAAKRRIIAHATGDESETWEDVYLRFLGIPFADHPDYRQEWKP